MTHDLIPLGVVEGAWETYEAWTAEKRCLACGNSPDGGATCSYGPYCGKGHRSWKRVSFPVFLGHLMRRKSMEEKFVKTKILKEDLRMDLKDTVSMMNHEDYKERFKAEYAQTKIRYEKLHRMTVKYEAGTLDFTPSCPIDLLKKQKSAMGQYLNCLEIRSEIEGVDLSGVSV